MGPFRVLIRLLSHDTSYEISDQQGSFHSKPPLTINLDESIMNMHNEVSLNLIVHELFHLCHYMYHLEGATEEVLVNAQANFDGAVDAKQPEELDKKRHRYKYPLIPYDRPV